MNFGFGAAAGGNANFGAPLGGGLGNNAQNANNAFGANPAANNANIGFGAAPAGNAFGAAPAGGNAFGAAPAGNAFGAAPGVGAPLGGGFGNLGGFGQANKAQAAPGFGSALPGFGGGFAAATPNANQFGMQQQQQQQQQQQPPPRGEIFEGEKEIRQIQFAYAPLLQKNSRDEYIPKAKKEQQQQSSLALGPSQQTSNNYIRNENDCEFDAIMFDEKSKVRITLSVNNNKTNN